MTVEMATRHKILAYLMYPQGHKDAQEHIRSAQVGGWLTAETKAELEKWKLIPLDFYIRTSEREREVPITHLQKRTLQQKENHSL